MPLLINPHRFGLAMDWADIASSVDQTSTAHSASNAALTHTGGSAVTLAVAASGTALTNASTFNLRPVVNGTPGSAVAIADGALFSVTLNPGDTLAFTANLIRINPSGSGSATITVTNTTGGGAFVDSFAVFLESEQI